eukprot:1051708-Prorocentrum_minimum.AAC.1
MGVCFSSAPQVKVGQGTQGFDKKSRRGVRERRSLESPFRIQISRHFGRFIHVEPNSLYPRVERSHLTVLGQVEPCSNTVNKVSRFVEAPTDSERARPKARRPSEHEAVNSEEWEVTNITSPNTLLTPRAVSPAFNNSSTPLLVSRSNSVTSEGQERVVLFVSRSNSGNSDTARIGPGPAIFSDDRGYQSYPYNNDNPAKITASGYEREEVRIPSVIKPAYQSHSEYERAVNETRVVASTRPKPVLDDVQFTLEESTDNLFTLDTPAGAGDNYERSFPSRPDSEPALQPSYIASPVQNHNQRNRPSHAPPNQFEEEDAADVASPDSSKARFQCG